MTNSTTLKLPVYGMTCAGCATGLRAALNALEGIQAEVNFALEAAQISFDPEIDHKNTLNLIMSLLDQKGYQTDTETILLTAEGWNCANCANTTSKMLNAQTLVLNAQANLTTEKVQVQTIKGALKKADIDTFSSLIPYTLSISSKQNLKAENVLKIAKQKAADKKALLTITLAVLLSLPFLLNMVTMFFNNHTSLLSPWLEFALATPVQFIIGARFYKGAWLSVKNYSTNMDVLVVLGTSSACFYSLFLLLGGLNQPLYFESSAMVITLVTLGKYLEHRAKQSTTSAINALMALRPDTAKVKKGNIFIDVSIDNDISRLR